MSLGRTGQNRASLAADDSLHCLLSTIQARILVTRQLMFSAVRQNVAQSFLPNTARLVPPDQHLLKVCTEAASENVQLTDRLFEVVSSGSSAFGMIDYHNAFNAAIILELGCLYRQDDASFHHGPQMGHVLDALQRAGLNGNDFARDCSTVLADFRQLREKLMQAMSRRVPSNNLPPPTPSAQVPGNLSPGEFDIPNTSAMSFTLDECLSPGSEFDRVLEEFTNWLEEGHF